MLSRRVLFWGFTSIALWLLCCLVRVCNVIRAHALLVSNVSRVLKCILMKPAVSPGPWANTFPHCHVNMFAFPPRFPDVVSMVT